MSEISRRGVLLGAAAAMAAAGLGSLMRTTTAQASVLWSAAYGATPTGPITLTDHVILDVDATVDSLTIPEGTSLTYQPDRTRTLKSRGNVVVEGVLSMHPDTHSRVHTLRFIDVDESAFVGGGSQVLATDVGLWVTGHGVLDAVGKTKTAWNRTGIDVTWKSWDDVRVAPTAVGDYLNFDAFVPGSPVPTVTKPDGSTIAAEVFNLTRNVVIGGTATGRAHVMFLGHSHDGGGTFVSAPQTIKYVRFEHVGPRKASAKGGNWTDLVQGRYGLHFHHCGDGSRGSVIEGVVVAHCGTRAFVPHASNGIVFRDCIAYDVTNNGFWWDRDEGTTLVNASHDVRYEKCAVFGVGVFQADPVYRLSGFELGSGTGIAVVDSVAVGVGRAIKGDTQPSGFHWPGGIKDPHFWEFTNNVGHNNEGAGIFAWQNDIDQFPRHLITRFQAYRNAFGGIDHGAYVSAYDYVGVTCFDNDGNGQFILHAQSRTNITDSVIDATGHSHALHIPHHSTSAKPENKNVLTGLDLRNSAVTAISVAEDTRSSNQDFVRCTVNGTNDLEPSDFTIIGMAAASVWRVQRRDGTAYQLHPDGSTTVIPAFA